MQHDGSLPPTQPCTTPRNRDNRFSTQQHPGIEWYSCVQVFSWLISQYRFVPYKKSNSNVRLKLESVSRSSDLVNTVIKRLNGCLWLSLADYLAEFGLSIQCPVQPNSMIVEEVCGVPPEPYWCSWIPLAVAYQYLPSFNTRLWIFASTEKHDTRRPMLWLQISLHSFASTSLIRFIIWM